MADVKWIKIVTDIFDDEKILLIESMPEHDSIIVIWFKLLCFAGKQNNSGVIMLNERIAYTDEMLATVFRRPVNTVRMALKTFEDFDMIRIVDGVITIPNWGKHQNLDQLENKKEYMRNYMREYREKQRLLTAGEPSPAPSDTPSEASAGKDGCKTNSKANVSQADKEEDKDIEQEKENNIYSSVLEHLNRLAGTSYRASSKKTQSLIKARVAEGFKLDDFRTVIDKKCAEWLGTDMEMYLRPETLFGTKFEGYLNANTRKGAKNESTARTADAITDKVGTWL